jgi:hypothetical protein
MLGYIRKKKLCESKATSMIQLLQVVLLIIGSFVPTTQKFLFVYVGWKFNYMRRNNK